MKVKALAIIGLAALLLVSGRAEANKYTFNNITNNNAEDAAIGEAQLFVEVTEQGTDKVKFYFTNIGLAASSITDVYFDDDVPLMVFVGFEESTGVDYAVGASPGNLPGGNDPYFFSSNYDYDSAAPAQPNGVNPGESLGIIF